MYERSFFEVIDVPRSRVFMDWLSHFFTVKDSRDSGQAVAENGCHSPVWMKLEEEAEDVSLDKDVSTC
jgi:hypothetical protein